MKCVTTNCKRGSDKRDQSRPSLEMFYSFPMTWLVQLVKYNNDEDCSGHRPKQDATHERQ